MRKIEVDTWKGAAFLLVLFSLSACDSSGEESRPSGRNQAEQAPIEVVDHTEFEASLAETIGEGGLLLNFWAIWCAPCVAELPDLVEVAHDYRERGGKVVGVSYDLMVAGADAREVVPAMREFVTKREIDIPILIYDGLDYEAINDRFELPGEIPVTLAIDKDGKIVDRQHGQAGKVRFDEMMRRALGI